MVAVRLPHLIRHAVVVTAFTSNAIYAHEIGASLDCHAGPHEFIQQLLAKKEIDPRPMKVSANSVNAYRPRQKQSLTALGFKVQAVFGSVPDDETFQQTADGNGAPRQIYGVAVVAGEDAVRERLRQIGSTATVKVVMPLVISAVVCEK
ncbi:hypothetical protein M3A49_16565 [Paraburkholderia sp. CNPSo 3076]|uniref:hypothetical protein n=1 Tax=Paraburkholderia sp. CNPSo 3076 TaxID=2940936 RepID=UPI002251510C|nr:hypothetical protein [Paraburkholderia sp. CNPSo 3076]MCX5541093.1 hypothetical protein [Paraburkholderia sp. CNPSo 3076]